MMSFVFVFPLSPAMALTLNQVSALEVEIQGIPQSLKPSYLVRLKQAKADLTRLKKLAKDVHDATARSELLSSGLRSIPSSDDPYAEHGRSDRDRLLTGMQILNDGSRRLTDTQRVALEAEDQGAGILRSLRMQRETIEGARDTVSYCLNKKSSVNPPFHRQLQGADTNIDRASGTLKKMIGQ